MKISSLAEQILKFSVKYYYKTENDSIDFDIIKEHFSDIPEKFLLKAAGILKADGFISTFEADNTIFYLTLLPSAIRNADENTLLKKGYTILKEIKEFLP